jgi:photosystem II stability/assembly factor-like uncharacterized protein
VYVAATGHPFGPNPERGVFRSPDGGKNWEKVLYVSEMVGAIDLAMDENNPRVLYAAMWRGERKPWTMISGGEDGGLFKTTDGGDHWEKLEKGLPKDLIGKIGVTVSPVNSNRLWAIIEAEEGKAGIYRSDDGGESWTLINTNARLTGRPWYYHHIHADPANENTVWNVSGTFWKSVDGGKSFSRIPMPHGDHHSDKAACRRESFDSVSSGMLPSFCLLMIQACSIMARSMSTAAPTRVRAGMS